MSKFLTPIPVDVQAVLNLLPDRAHVLDVRFNPEAAQVEVEWDDDDFVTPYSFALEFPAEQLKTRKLPKNTKLRKNATPAPQSGKFELSKAPPQELPGGPTTAIRKTPGRRADVPTQAAAELDADQGERAKGASTK